MVSIHSLEENNFVLNQARNCTISNYFGIGAKVIQENPLKLFWFDGSDYDYENFQGHELFNWDYESIVIDKPNNYWNFYSLKGSKPFTCKKPL